MIVSRNKENKQLKKDFDKWKKEAQARIKLFKQGKLEEEKLYNWMMEKNSYCFNEIVFEFINIYHFTMRDCIRYYQLLKVLEEFSNTSTRYRFGEENGKELIKIFFLPILLGIKVIDLKLYIDIINGNGYDKFFESINKLDVVKEGLNYYMNKDKEGKVSEESFKKQLLKMYNAIFNHKNDYKEYSNSQVTLDRYSYNYLMEILSLLRKGLKY